MFGVSTSKLIIALFVGYFAYSVYTLYSLFAPPVCNQKQFCIKSYISKLPKLGLLVTTSLYPSPKSKLTTIWKYENFSLQESVEKSFNVSIPESTRNNGTLFVHAFLYPAGQSPESSYVSHDVSKITTYAVPKDLLVNLLSSKESEIDASKKKLPQRKKPVAHWRPQLVINILAENLKLDRTKIPGEMDFRMRYSPDGKYYYPIVFINELGFRYKDLLLIDKESSVQPLTISYSSISFGKMRLWINLGESFKTLTNLGFTENDSDEIKALLLDTNFYLLMLTFTVSAFHILFDFLAFKSDISYWRHKDSIVGCSIRGVIWRCVSTAVIFCYLLNEKTSLLILIPTGIGMFIEVWKVTKALKIKVEFKGFIPKFQIEGSSDQEKETESFDSEAMKYLSYLLYPMCIGGALYSLVYIQHKSWYSWTINSLVNGVYAFGFLFMLPQLFVNYKLKSVAHLPWKALMYKAFNTFIDDIFAFLITMPTAHRVACFRDDLVFVIFLYQRWLYPVDKKRPNEFGISYKEEEVTTKKESKKHK